MDKIGHFYQGLEAMNSSSSFKLEACVGYDRYDFDNPVTIPQLIAQADVKLYEMKKNR
jgi:hypothetical protein